MTPDPILIWLGLPVAASAHAGEVDRIMALVHWLMLLLFVGWSVFFIYVLLRFRSGAHPKADYRGVRGGWSNWVEGGVLVAEIVLLAFFSIPFWTRNVDAAPPPENQAVVVRVIAEQFAWNVHYPGADGVFGRTDIRLVSPDNPLGLDRDEPVGKDDLVVNGSLNLPVDSPVIVYLSSKDVIHSFALPQMRVQAGCDSRHRPACLVHAHDDRAVGYRVFATVRPRALPDERRLSDPDARGISSLAQGRGILPLSVNNPHTSSVNDFTRLHIGLCT